MRAAATVASPAVSAAAVDKDLKAEGLRVNVELGCFTYVFSEFPFDRALEAISRAGYRGVGLGLSPRDVPIPGDDSGAAEGKAVRARLDGAGLRPLFTFAPRVTGEGGIDRYKRRIDFSHAAGLPFIIATGAFGYRKFPNERLTPGELAAASAPFFAAYRELAPLAQKAGVTIALKPHTGTTATSRECLEAMREIAHPAVQICYDAGNVHFYEGLAPEDDVVPVLPFVKALCLKDHQGPRANPNFPVPGEGAVDHRLLFSRLRDGGFNGPMVLERVDGTTKKADMPLEMVVERITRARRNVEAALSDVGATIA